MSAVYSISAEGEGTTKMTPAKSEHQQVSDAELFRTGRNIGSGGRILGNGFAKEPIKSSIIFRCVMAG